MPCLIVVGHPSAGKTTLTNLLKERALLHDAIDEVVVLNEESECACTDKGATNEAIESSSETNKAVSSTTKQELYETSAAEKQTRGALKAAFDRAVKKSGGNNKNNRRLVILDSLNYIKGFRYELHCISKASGEKHGILWVLNRLSVVQEWNKNYSPELLQELISRFEPPDDRNRWDKPLFTVDVAAAANVALPLTEDKEVQSKNVSSKNEVLEHSVYNMHALGEAFGASPVTEKSDNAPDSASVIKGPQQPTKTPSSSAAPASKAPKKSAFQRRKKAAPPSDKNEKKVSRDFNPENKIIFDTSILTSQGQNTSIISNEGMRNKKSSPVSNPSQSASTQQNGTTITKSLEEQLDDILDTFLLQTKNLKEGMSTRQYA